MDLVESSISKNSAARHPWELARLDVVRSLINEEFKETIDSGIKVLDIGCGDTWLIEQLSKSFPKVKFIAVDTAFNNELLAKYRDRLDSNTFKVYNNLEDALKEKPAIDLVLLLDVIEHIEDEIGFLQGVLSNTDSINDASKFLITVPAFQSLYCAHDEFLGHYRRYTNGSLENRIGQAKLKVETKGYFFSSLLAPRLIIKILELVGLKSKKVKGIGNYKAKPIDGIIKNTLIFDYRFGKLFRNIGINLPGLSNYAIASPMD